VFLYFHFGDAKDEPGSTSTTDPDIFIVELSAVDTAGTWSFGGGKDTGLSNIALIGSEKSTSSSSGGASSSGDIPEPNTCSMALLGLGLLAGSFAWRRHARRV
jgi:MYXO-CTERM domain-containing protein